MSADVIAWLRSDEGLKWSRDRAFQPAGAGLAPLYSTAAGDPGEDPTGRPPVKGPALIAATGDAA